MKWQKLGLIFCPDGKYNWMISHASVPVAEYLEQDIFRIYFSSRDAKNRSHTAWLDIDINRPAIVLASAEKPILSPGELGEFDDSGAMLSWIVLQPQIKYFYYIGWNLGVTVPFRNSIGLAIWEKGRFPKRYSNAPIVDRSSIDPYFVASCCLRVEDCLWKMWYLSCTGWTLVNSIPRHSYHIRYAESIDGISWKRDGISCIDFKDPGEYAISRPCVLNDNGLYKMWYSYRGISYRIGYAESLDGIHWTRLDQQVGISVSDFGWDSEMIEYPFVFDHKGSRYMLYNGNGYGKTGFGLAVLT
jgi:hypothetical protein